MWILIFIVFNGPMSVERIEVLETYTNKRDCIKRGKQASTILPPRTSISCEKLIGTLKT